MDDNFERLDVNGDDFWMSKLRSDEKGSERRTENSDGSECQNWKAMMALNAKTENDDGSERQTEKWWLGTPNEDAVMALNSKTENDDGSECQTEKWWRLWTPNWK